MAGASSDPSDPAIAWVPLLESGALEAGTARPVDCGGFELVAWRDVDGRVCVMDARCPHQWSHLGVEGVVDGRELVCASHFWRFDREGVGTKLNVKGRRDPKADIRVFPCREGDGFLEVGLDPPPVL